MDHTHSNKIIKSIYTSFFATLAVVVLVATLYFVSQYAQYWVRHTGDVKSMIISLSEKFLRQKVYNEVTY